MTQTFPLDSKNCPSHPTLSLNKKYLFPGFYKKKAGEKIAANQTFMAYARSLNIIFQIGINNQLIK